MVGRDGAGWGSEDTAGGFRGEGAWGERWGRRVMRGCEISSGAHWDFKSDVRGAGNVMV